MVRRRTEPLLCIDEETARTVSDCGVRGRHPLHNEISRRREGLSFSHHVELAALSPDEQERWLNRAECGALTPRSGADLDL